MFKGTTILAVKKDNKTVVAGDGQVSHEAVIVKHGAKKVRRLYHDNVVAGFAGATADAFTLFERFEGKLEQFSGNLKRAAVELAKDWRTDKMLRQLNALLVVADKDHMFTISGTGDVIEADDDMIGVGSGGAYALSAARALVIHSDLDARGIAEQSLKIASGICVYTNDQFIIEEL
jgi:ATP-dependent HslUV protease subunit HslV